MTLLTLSDASAAQFGVEYRTQVEKAKAGLSDNEVDYLHGARPSYDRLSEYGFAARSSNMGLSKRGLEIAGAESYFGLYASAYHGQFSVATLALPGRGALPVHWPESLRRPDAVTVDKFSNVVESGRTFDNIYFFRLIENIEDHLEVIDRIKAILAPAGVLTFTAAFSHSGSKPYDSGGGFRVYDKVGIEHLVSGLQPLRFETLESAEEVDASPRMFDMTVACVTAQKPW